MAGRPTKLDDLVSKRIVDAIAKGATREAAAEAARIHRDTLQDWLARGRDGDERYSDFSDRLKRAEAEAEIAMVAIVREAAIEKWQAAAWWLERRRPDAYALRREFTAPREVAAEQDGDDLEVTRSVLAALESRKDGSNG